MSKELALTEGKNLEWIDAVRGIAIAMVITTHVAGPSALKHWGNPFLAGIFGVQLFYAASALTLAMSFERHTRESAPLRNYALRRFFRIAPLYWIAIAAFGLLHALDEGTFAPSTHTPLKVITGFFFVHTWFPGAISNPSFFGNWSIGVEMSFYLLVPFLIPWVRGVGRALAFALLAIPFAGVAAWFGHKWYGLEWPIQLNSFLFFWLPTQLPAFAMGFLAHALIRSPGVGRFLSTRKKTAALVLMALAGLFYVELCFGWIFPPLPVWLIPAAAGCFAACLMVAVATHAMPLLVNRGTISLGKISYSLYIVHVWPAIWLTTFVREKYFPVFQEPFGHFLFFVLMLVVNFSVWIPVAMLTHRFIEKPGMALGKRIIARLESRAPSRQQP